VITDINSEDRLVQKTFANYLETVLGWENVYAYNQETFGDLGTLGRASGRDVVLVRDLRAALARLNPDMPEWAREQAIGKLTAIDFSRSLVQHNKEFYGYIRDGVPVEWRDTNGQLKYGRARVIDFRNPSNNRFLAVRELKIQGVRVPYYNRRADLVCYVNGLPLVFIELKAVYHNIRQGFDNNLTDYLHESSITQAFYHNAFLIVSNGDRARYGSITSKWDHFAEWKRNEEKDKGSLEATVLLDGMLTKERLLDLVENFIIFDDSRAGGTRKVIARNHQALGVNEAVESVRHQELLKLEYPVGKRLLSYEEPYPEAPLAAEEDLTAQYLPVLNKKRFNGSMMEMIKPAHPDLGKLGVFWHTQGSGKSYSMAFFAEKVRRMVPGNHTFVIITDREGLDTQIWRTFIGCGITDENTPRASSGLDLKKCLGENHRYIFTLIHKFNQPVKEPYSERDDIIVISDEAHRTQGGRFARNMRRALPNASFIGFTGTPILKGDLETRNIFGKYVSRYDFKRSEEDGSTVKLVYENRGEKLGVANLDLNDKIAEAVERAELDGDQSAMLEKLLGRDYEVVTADDRLDKLANDFVDHCSTRWQTGKSMLVCIDKITCARMFQRIEPIWHMKRGELSAALLEKEAALDDPTDGDEREELLREIEFLRGQAEWMSSTIIELIISEAQNEVRDFERWNFDIIPHRVTMKNGFETGDGSRVDVESAFKDPQHPFRVAIVCAMWLTGFDVESLATLYIDKPMKAHTLMQAIARANRVYPGKDCGVIVDYNGLTRSLREALASYAEGEEPGEETEVVAPIAEMIAALEDAIEAAENHLRDLGFEPKRLIGARGFDRIEALRDAVDAVYTSDDSKRRFEIMARQVVSRYKTLLMEPSAYQFCERRDNIETIYKKLQERRDTADVTELLKELHRIVNEAIRAQQPGDDHTEGLKIDLSEIDFQRLKEEFAGKVRRKRAALKDIREVVESKLMQMMLTNPDRMDYYRRYQEIVADYNREKDRVTIEETFARLMDLVATLDEEQQRAAREGLNEDELALFDLLFKENITKAERERLKQASKALLAALEQHLNTMPEWVQTEATRAEVRMFILDNLWQSLPQPPFSDSEKQAVANKVYNFVWHRAAGSQPLRMH